MNERTDHPPVEGGYTGTGIDPELEAQYWRDTVQQPKGLTATPDVPNDVRDCYDRASFRVGTRTFKRVRHGSYTDGQIKVYCDQLDSTSWRATLRHLSTAWYWTPEIAVLKLLESVQVVR